ncbi:MAG TPA: S8 family serine peptidase [Thermoanaerobaculia bacterium]|nr:S8 family serine peptidase [Thermoanaerobaculia bacterium]
MSGPRLRRIFCSIVVTAMAAAPVLGATAPEIRIDPTTLYFGASSPQSAQAAATQPPSSRPPVATALREKARRDKVRVIVELTTPFGPEGALTAAQATAQRQGISGLQDTVLRKLAGQKVAMLGRYRHIPFLALEVDADALDLLSRLPQVAGIQEDYFQKPLLASANAVIGSGVAWSLGLTGAGQTIAVLDTGVDKTHPYFSSGPHNKVVSEACYSSNIPSDYYYDAWTSLCPGGVAESTAPGSGANCPAAVSSFCQHGTHVAGIAAGNDGVGPNFGAARDADLISIQVFSARCYGGSSSCDLGAWLSDELKGLEQVYALAGTYNIAAVNVSLGYSGYSYSSRSYCDSDNPALKAAIDNLRSIDIATIGAGGDGYPSSYLSAPACVSSAISVGATDDDDQVASFSPVGPLVDLMAPGVSITSAVPGGGTATLNGTSMAAPFVAGAWAILRQEYPSASVSDVLAILRGTAVPVSGYGFNDMRRINVAKAVTAGPFVSQAFTIHNDGGAVLSVLSLQLETPVSWIHWTPEAPFDVAPGGSRQVSVMVDLAGAPSGVTMNRLIVGSTDADENPYPDAVHLVIDKESCYLLTRTHTGTGGLPDASPASSPGCPPGEYVAGETLQLTAHPATGWALQGWSGTDNDASLALANSLVMPAAPHTVTAAYYAICYPLTVSHTGSGGDPVATPANSPGCSAGQYKYQEAIQLTASPARGWRIDGWTNTSADTSHGTANSLVMPAAAASVSVNYLQGLPYVLVITQYPSSYNLSMYTTALNALGLIYDVWKIDEQGTPDAGTLAAYPRVILDTGFNGSLGASVETVLTNYLNAGGGLLLSGSDLYGPPSSFLQTYAGIQSLTSDYLDNGSVTGRGSALSGLGPYSIYGYNTMVTPAAGAEVALQDQDGGVEGVSKIGPTYHTLFTGSLLGELSGTNDQRDVISAGLDFVGTVFADTPRGYWAKKWIESLYRNGVTGGCVLSPRQYCPEVGMTRGLMATFLLLSKEGPGYTPPPCTTAPFNDVPASDPLCPWIQELVHRGVTSGCGGGNYCPETVVTRSQMSVFLLATLQGQGYAPPACSSSTPFLDIPASSPFCPWVAELARRGITAGCGGGYFCPENPVSRAQMAIFLVVNFHLPIF